MFTVVFLLLLCLVVAVGVVGTVAVGAHRTGRDLLAVRGNDVVTRLRAFMGTAAAKAGELATGTLDRVRTLTSARKA